MLLLMQIVRAVRVGQIALLSLPGPEEVVCGQVQWGMFTKFGTPAYWRAQVWLDEPVGRYQPSPLGGDLAEEVAACILAGFGMPSEVGLEAFQRIRRRGLIDNPRGDLIEKALLEPLGIRGRKCRYRFPRQKALQLSQALSRIRFLTDFDDALLLRDALMTLPGVGPKTASWIVRNRLGSDAVAILDVHVIRACVQMGLFIEFSVQHYQELERCFVQFAEALGVRASILDSAMWQQLRVIPRAFLSL